MKYIRNFPKIDVVILAGGKGSRIKKYLNNSSKPMLNFEGKPFIDYIIKKISSYPINHIYILAGYKGKKIFDRYNKTHQNFVPISCYIEKSALGTGGSLRLIENKISSNFIVINGDTYFDIDFSIFFKSKLKRKNYMILSNDIFYKKNKQLTKLNIGKNKKIYYDNKSDLFNGGIYFFNKTIFKFINKIKKKTISLEKEIIEKEIKKNKLFGIIDHNFFIDIGTNENLKRSKFLIPKITNKSALFLDRDGVINYDNGYTFKIKDFKFKPHVINFLKKITKKKNYIFIVTNQAGIAHGFFTEKNFINLHRNLKKTLFKKGILINDVKYCPFHKNAAIKKFKKNSKYRKPGNLMIKNLRNNWNIDIKKSIMIGDKLSDKKCAAKSNIKFYYPDDIIINS